MSWNNDNIPQIAYEYDDNEAKHTIAAISATLDKNNFGDAGATLRNMMAQTDVNLEQATKHTADETVKEVGNLMKARQYHSKSGYVGHGLMVSNLKDHVDGKRHTVYTDATNKGYNYSQAFEFGLLTRDYPAHHPFQDAASHLGTDKPSGGLYEDEVEKAIRKGFD